MTFVTTQPEMLATAAGELVGVGSATAAQNAAAVAPTMGVAPAAADEVSALTAAQFASHAAMYQEVSAHAAVVHELVVDALEPAPIRMPPPKPPTPAQRSERNATMTAAFDFGAFPPEVNSAKMYAGPGSASMLSAAAAWNGLASELRSQAANYSSIVSNLTGDGWQGRASAAMAAAAAQYMSWMNTTAAQAEQTAGQAQAAAAAYEAAYGNDRAASGDRRQPQPVGVVGRNECAGSERAGNRGHRGPLRPDVGAGRRGDVRLRRRSRRQRPRCRRSPLRRRPRRRERSPDRPPRPRRPPASSTQAALSQLTSTVPGALQGMATPAASTVVNVDALRARGSADRQLIRKLSARQLLEHMGTKRQHLEHVDLDRGHQPAAGGADLTSAGFWGPARWREAKAWADFHRWAWQPASARAHKEFPGWPDSVRPAPRCRQAWVKPRPSVLVGAAQLDCHGAVRGIAARLGAGQHPVGHAAGGGGRTRSRPDWRRSGCPCRRERRDRGQPLPHPPADGAVLGRGRVKHDNPYESRDRA